MIIRMMYVLPMILGRTYHVGKNSVGVDIFKPEDVADPREITESFFRSSFKTIETSTDVKEILEINGDLSLNIKAGLFAIRGFGAYVKESIRSQNSVDILTKVSFRTVSKTLDQAVRPIEGWRAIAKEYLGTHYVKSILYGGDLIASIRFKAMNAEDLKNIRATIKTSLAGGTALDLVGEGKLESLDRKLEKKASMEINYFATVPLEGVPNNIEGLRNLITGFEKHVKKVNGGIGAPVEVELAELSNFDRDWEYIKNTELETELDFFEEYLDDLLSTKYRLKSWVEEFPDTFTTAQQKEISEFSERLNKVLRKFTDTIANLDLEKGSTQLDEAKEMYKEGKSLIMAGRYRRDLNKLLKRIVPKSDYTDKFTSVYTHYGSSNCTEDKSTVTIHSGHVASSPRNQIGGGYNYLCMPTKPAVQEQNLNISKLSLISGVKYGLMETRPNQLFDTKSVLRGVMCAMCLVLKQTLYTFQGTADCPAVGAWKLQYSGYLMASTDIERSETVCVDLKMESNQESYMGLHDQSLNFVMIMQSDGNYGFISCAVCSK